MTAQWNADMEKRMSDVEDELKKPLIPQRQLILGLVASITLIFAAGGWAAVMQSNVKTMGETLIEMRGDLKKLGEVSTMKIELDLVKGEVTRLRNERDAQRDREFRSGR